MIKSMVNSCLPEFSDFTRVFSPVKVLCNGPQGWWEGEFPSHGRDLFEMLVQNTSFSCIKMLKFT